MITKKELILRIIDLETQVDWLTNEMEKLKKRKKNEVKK